MVTYFCRNCWSEIEERQSVCLQCGDEQSRLDDETFIAKLIRALDHPEPETPIRAAYVLGKLRVVDAIPTLLDVIHRKHDFYIVAAAIEALGEIGDRTVLQEIEELLINKSPLPVCAAAEHALSKLQST